MAYGAIQMFMEKLKQLINSNDIPVITNNPEIISERPQFQLLYDELSSIIQTLGFINQHQDLYDLEKVKDLKQRFTDAAEEAEYIVDLFLSGAHIRNNQHLLTSGLEIYRSYFNRSQLHRRSFKSVIDLFLSCVHIRNNGDYPFNPSLYLDGVRRSFKYLKVEFKKVDSSRRPERTINHSATISISRNTMKVLDEIVMGRDRDVELVRDKLVEDQKKVDVVSIVGMGGIGKTTLATKVFNDPFVVYHFHVRVWVTVSQIYDKRAALIQILESIRTQLCLQNTDDSQLRELVHKSLIGRRYLVVIDDIWDTEAWDNLKLFFPHDNNGSRIMLTTRLTEVAKHASSGLIHHLGYLNKERSWELLCEKVFDGNECPEWSFKPGMQIVENCKGLPLVLVVIAGVLAKDVWNRNLWMEIAERTGLYIVGEENGCMETLGLSYNHLPLHLRECFLYLGSFPEDYEIQVKRLIRLWVAEGFIQEDGNRSLENIAEGYLLDLVDRNLVIVDSRKSNGGIKACKVHDLIRDLCLKKAKEEQFILRTNGLILSSDVITTPYKVVRKFISTYETVLSHTPIHNVRSNLYSRPVSFISYDMGKYMHLFVLLRVLDLLKCELMDFPNNMDMLVHLRYLGILCSFNDFPSSICKLWNLQTLCYHTSYFGNLVLPSNISDLVNLRHLSSNNLFYLPSIEKPMNLHTISRVELEDGAHSFQRSLPCIKKLKCRTTSDQPNDFKSLTYLERLSLWSFGYGKIHYTFPATLKTLTLARCSLPWSKMPIIQSLPHLQVLKLHREAFKGSCWNTDEQEFPQLKFLRLEELDFKRWEVYSKSFPCLKQLEIFFCNKLEEISLEIGDIPTLKLIKIKGHSTDSLRESVRGIQEAQQDMGNYDLKIDAVAEPNFWFRGNITI